MNVPGINIDIMSGGGSFPTEVEMAVGAIEHPLDLSVTPSGSNDAPASALERTQGSSTKSTFTPSGSKSTRKYVVWSEDMEHSLVLQAYTEQVHTAPHGQKGKRFQAVTEKINSLEMFAEAGGVTQSRVEDVYRRIMTAHREKLLNGERMSGEFEGSPINSLEYLCHNIMREEEEYLSVKWGGSRAEEKQAAADKNEARVQEAMRPWCATPAHARGLAIPAQSSSSRDPKKRTCRSEEGCPPAIGQAAGRENHVELESVLARYFASHADDGETKRREIKIREDEARAALLQATAIKEVIADDREAKRQKMEIEKMDAETRRVQAQNQTLQLQNQAAQVAATTKLTQGLLAALERLTNK